MNDDAYPQYVTQQAAFDKSSELNNNPIGYCPLINNLCEPACVCFGRSVVVNDGIGSGLHYVVTPTRCNNRLLFGDE